MIPNKVRERNKSINKDYGSLYPFYKINFNLFPISFSIPECKIVDYVPIKSKIISDLIPGKIETYIYYKEQDYYDEYKKSIFAYTFKKGGWDCLRHYEILACGCIPYFPDINECPDNILFILPKDLIKIGNELFLSYKDKSINDLTENDKYILNEHIQKLILYTKTYLTTRNLSNYIIKTLNEKCYIFNIKKVLLISAHDWTEYLRCSILHGLKSVFGKDCHDYPKIKHLYKNEDIDYVNYCYGRGFSLSNLLEQNCRDNSLDETIEDDIKNNKYDIIIWADFHRWYLPNCASRPNLEYFDLAKKYYDSNRLIFLNGWDRQYDIYDYYMSFVNKGHTVFVREFLD